MPSYTSEARRLAHSLFHLVILLAAWTLQRPAEASAQGTDWPARTVTVVTGYAAGGNSDVLARLLTNRMQDQLKQPFVIESRVGGGGAVAMRSVGQASPDGYTLFFAAAPQIGVVPQIQKLGFNPLEILTPVSVFATGPFLLTVNASTPVNSVPEFVKWAKGRSLSYGSGGAGSNAHLTAAVFLKRAGLEGTNVPFRGSGSAMTALIAGQIDLVFGNASDVVPFVDGGQLKVVAVAAERRMKQLPDIPTIGETYPRLAMPSWNGVMAPAKTPRPVVDKIADQVIAAAKDPDVADKLYKLGLEPNGTSPEAFAAQIEREQPQFDDGVKAAGLVQQ
jgi:tripartite-type tricarboxylate transporter receptor subunit TctC